MDKYTVYIRKNGNWVKWSDERDNTLIECIHYLRIFYFQWKIVLDSGVVIAQSYRA